MCRQPSLVPSESMVKITTGDGEDRCRRSVVPQGPPSSWVLLLEAASVHRSGSQGSGGPAPSPHHVRAPGQPRLRRVLVLSGPGLVTIGPMVRIELERVEALELLGVTLA